MHIFFQGVLLGLCSFLTIGMFHPIVVKAEYYFGTKIWWLFLFVGILFVTGSLLLESIFWSAILAIIGFSCFWSIKEIFQQRQRVLKGWFPMNPKRKHEYE